MPRAYKRTWIKLYCYERLHGSVAFQLEPEERSVWDELLCLAGLCGLNGLISDRDRRPYPHSFIAHELHISEELFERTLGKCKEEGRITENEHGIYITNWVAYQSEYERQKSYRQKGTKPEPTPEQKEINEINNEISIAKLDAKEQLGRPLSTCEIDRIIEEVNARHSA